MNQKTSENRAEKLNDFNASHYNLVNDKVAARIAEQAEFCANQGLTDYP